MRKLNHNLLKNKEFKKMYLSSTFGIIKMDKQILIKEHTFLKPEDQTNTFD